MLSKTAFGDSGIGVCIKTIVGIVSLIPVVTLVILAAFYLLGHHVIDAFRKEEKEKK